MAETKVALKEEVELDSSPKDRGLFTLTYKVRMLVGSLNFIMPTRDLRVAMARGEEFCIKQGYRFIRVDPMFVDLDEEDRKREQRNVS